MTREMITREELGRRAFEAHYANNPRRGVAWTWEGIAAPWQEAWCRSAEAVRAAVLAEKDVDAFNERIR